MSNNIHELRIIAIDMAKGINLIAKNYNVFISIEEKVINLQKDINNIRTKSYMAQKDIMSITIMEKLKYKITTLGVSIAGELANSTQMGQAHLGYR